MVHAYSHFDKEDVRSLARGRWPEIIIHFTGINPTLLDDTREHPCPRCGGTTRFRMINLMEGAGRCNQCFPDKCGDGFALLCWYLDWSFEEAVNQVGYYLKGPVSQSQRDEQPLNGTDRFNDQLEFIDADQEQFASWAKHKPPVTGEAVQAAGARLCLWPKKAPRKKRLTCVAFPAYRDAAEPVGWILYRADGQNFPAIPDGLRERKTHNVGGSSDGWVFFGGRARLESAHTIVKMEGVPDALSIYPYLPDGYAVTTNICGAKGASKCL